MWGLITLGVLGAGSALKKKVVESTHQRKYVSIAEWMLNDRTVVEAGDRR